MPSVILSNRLAVFRAAVVEAMTALDADRCDFYAASRHLDHLAASASLLSAALWIEAQSAASREEWLKDRGQKS